MDVEEGTDAVTHGILTGIVTHPDRMELRAEIPIGSSDD
jgi:hypothetical protein